MRFDQVSWFDDLLVVMRRSLMGDGEILKRQVKNGIARLWKESNTETYMITRAERVDGVNVLVVCCYEGKNVTAAVINIIAMAKGMGCQAIRYHTKHRGLKRLVADKYGFECIEKRKTESVYLLNLRA